MTRDPDRPVREAWIVDAVRTPIGRYGGALASIRPDDLAALVVRAVVDRAGIDPAVIEDVILGCANQAGEDNRNVARMAALLAGLPVEVGRTDRQSTVRLGSAGDQRGSPRDRGGRRRRLRRRGVESMTRAPYVMAKPENAWDRGSARAPGHDARLAVHQPEARRDALPLLDGRDRGERRRALGRQSRAAGRLRAREPSARRRGDRRRPVRRPDRPGRGRRTEGRGDARRP